MSEDARVDSAFHQEGNGGEVMIKPNTTSNTLGQEKGYVLMDDEDETDKSSLLKS